MLPSSGPPGGCLWDLFLCSSFLSPLAKRLFFQTFVVPEWEPVGTAVFVPLAASERLKKRVIGWKFLPGTSPVASVPGYSLRSLSLDYASPPIAFHLRFLHCSLPVCLPNRLQFGLCVWHMRIVVVGYLRMGVWYMRMGVWIFHYSNWPNKPRQLIN
jgi:hypothetical protein